MYLGQQTRRTESYLTQILNMYLGQQRRRTESYLTQILNMYLGQQRRRTESYLTQMHIAWHSSGCWIGRLNGCIWLCHTSRRVGWSSRVRRCGRVGRRGRVRRWNRWIESSRSSCGWIVRCSISHCRRVSRSWCSEWWRMRWLWRIWWICPLTKKTSNVN